MNLAALKALIADGESQTLELKKSTAEKDPACRSLCALANGQGGHVVFGVTPSGKVVGQKVTDRTLEELAQEFQGFEPPLQTHMQRIRVSEIDSQGLEALLVQVTRAADAPISFRGVPYERVLDTTRTMPRANYQRLLAEAMHATERWEMQPAAGCDISNLDTDELVVTIDEAIRRGRMEDPGTRNPMGLLRGLGLLLPDDQLSRAAVALFCKDDHNIPEFPQFNLRVARFKGTTRDEFLDNRQYSGNAFALMRRAERFLIDWNALSAPRVQTLEPMDRQSVPPSRHHRNLGARHAQNCQPHASRRLACTHLARAHAIGGDDVCIAAGENAGGNAGENAGENAKPDPWPP